MTTRSMSIRKIDNFIIPEQMQVLANGTGMSIGTISNVITTLTVERHVLEMYRATYEEIVNETISVFDAVDNDYDVYNEYIKTRAFNLFYDKNTKTLYSTAPSTITFKFLKHLSKNSKATVSKINGIEFSFTDVAELLESTKLIRFNSDDDHVNKKTFGGDNVVENNEAGDALLNDTTSQLIGVLRVGTKDYTISLSKPGTLVAYTNIDKKTDDRPQPMLEFTIRALDELNIN